MTLKSKEAKSWVATLMSINQKAEFAAFKVIDHGTTVQEVLHAESGYW